MEPEERFWWWINERHQIFIKKDIQALEPPWTEDQILREYRFTNVFRELDRTTRWFRKHVRDDQAEDPNVLMATVIFRWFNRIRTGIYLGTAGLFRRWDSERARYLLEDVHPVSTGSYIIKTPDGMNKLEGICWCIDNVWKVREETYRAIISLKTLEHATEYLMDFPYLGGFMAYEIVSDLRHTHILRNAPDVMTWAHAGPGAKRGLNRIHNRPTKKNIGTDQAVKEMKDLLDDSWFRTDSHVPTMEMRDIEHSLCEFDKYMRVFQGEGRPRQRYKYNVGD